MPSSSLKDFYVTEGVCQALARNQTFEIITMFVILINSLYIMVDADYNNSTTIMDAEWYCSCIKADRQRPGRKGGDTVCRVDRAVCTVPIDQIVCFTIASPILPNACAFRTFAVQAV